MAYNEKLTLRLREALVGLTDLKIEEKKMFRGVTFMIDGKMCVSAGDDKIMCRIDPILHDEAIKKKACETVLMRGRPYRGFVYVQEAGFRSKKDLEYWLRLALDFNKRAKPTKKKKRRTK